jgi:hypothetical protein
MRLAIIIAAAVIAAAILFVGRWELYPTPGSPAQPALMLDRWSGTVHRCHDSSEAEKDNLLICGDAW